MIVRMFNYQLAQIDYSMKKMFVEYLEFYCYLNLNKNIQHNKNP